MGYLLPVSDWMEPGSGSEVRLTAGETAAMGAARSSITRSLGLEVPDLKGTKRGTIQYHQSFTLKRKARCLESQPRAFSSKRGRLNQYIDFCTGAVTNSDFFWY